MRDEPCECPNSEEHPCPYVCDINNENPNDENEWCNCCDICTQNCVDDI